MEPLGTATIILRRQEEVLEQDKNAALQETNLLLDIGLVKICGEERAEIRDDHLRELGVNIRLRPWLKLRPLFRLCIFRFQEVRFL